MEGYQVLLAHDGAEALDIANRHRGPIELLLTDVVMQGLNGLEVASRLQSARPDIKTLFMTGDDLERDGVRRDRIVAKPFSIKSLLAAVRALIGSCDDA
jgi:DNA-binding response OmpR family regulator